MNEIKSFEQKTVAASEKFQALFPEFAAEIRALERMRAIELCAAANHGPLLAKIHEKYAELLSDVATEVLEADKNSHPTKHAKTMVLNFTGDVRRILNEHTRELIEAGVIVEVPQGGQCLHCGISLTPGTIYVRMLDGSSDAVDLKCCQDTTYLTEDSEICIAV